MKKLFQTTLLFAILISFTSCFDVTEEVKMNADGSGELRLNIDLSQSKGNLAGYMAAGEINGVEIPSEAEIKSEIKKLKKALSKIKGISKVKAKSDFGEFVFEVTANFKNMKALNKAINASVKTFNQTPFPLPRFKHFSFKENKFSRLFNYTDERFTQEEFDGMMSVVRYLMESAKVVSIYRFEENVKNISNSKAKISPSKKAVMLEGNISEFATGKKTLENHISF
ncbi:MAG: hypothetical protein AB8H03_19660 [Saprospiraceae bacterium]